MRLAADLCVRRTSEIDACLGQARMRPAERGCREARIEVPLNRGGKHMTPFISAPLMFLLVAAGFGIGGETAPAQTTVTGWFSCDRCAPAARVKAKRIRPTNRECAQKCLAEGARLVFLDEKARRVLQVANPDAAKGQESHHVQVAGSIDARGETLTVSSVKVLEEYVAKCLAPASNEK